MDLPPGATPSTLDAARRLLCAECTQLAASHSHDLFAASTGSTKIRKMLSLLTSIRAADAREKTIVFSQFTSFLDLVEPHLSQRGFGYVRYDGSMRPPEREAALERIRSDAATTVILISFKAGSTGLNLTACSRVILMDLWWNPQIEEQAFDRAHRLGQVRDVTIYKLSIKDTVEERILGCRTRSARSPRPRSRAASSSRAIGSISRRSGSCSTATTSVAHNAIAEHDSTGENESEVMEERECRGEGFRVGGGRRLRRRV